MRDKLARTPRLELVDEETQPDGSSILSLRGHESTVGNFTVTVEAVGGFAVVSSMLVAHGVSNELADKVARKVAESLSAA